MGTPIHPRSPLIRWAVTGVLCFAILGPVGPRKLLRALAPAPVDRVAMLADTDGVDDVQPGVLPMVGCFVPDRRPHASVPRIERPVGRDMRGRVETSRSPPA